jgi:hypothetical protein
LAPPPQRAAGTHRAAPGPRPPARHAAAWRARDAAPRPRRVPGCQAGLSVGRRRVGAHRGRRRTPAFTAGVVAGGPGRVTAAGPQPRGPVARPAHRRAGGGVTVALPPRRVGLAIHPDRRRDDGHRRPARHCPFFHSESLHSRQSKAYACKARSEGDSAGVRGLAHPA